MKTEKTSSKSTQIFLLFLVAGIWGGVIWRFFKLKSPEENIDTTYLIKNQIPNPENKESYITNYTLNLSYPDPFLGNAVRVRSSNNNAKSNLKNKKNDTNNVASKFPIISKPTEGPSVVYKGFAQASDGTSFARMSINGKTYSIKTGVEYEGVKLLKLTRDSITILYNNKKRVIKR